MDQIDTIIIILEHLPLKDVDKFMGSIGLNEEDDISLKRYKENRSAKKISKFMKRLKNRIIYIKNDEFDVNDMYFKWMYIIHYHIEDCIDFYYGNTVDWKLSILNKYEREKLDNRSDFTRKDFIKLIRIMDIKDLFAIGY